MSAALLPDSAGPPGGAVPTERASAGLSAGAGAGAEAAHAGWSGSVGAAGFDADAHPGGLARNRITASASIVAVAGPGGVTRLPVLASQVPLVLRRTPEAVYVVGGAAGPIGGDELRLRISVGAGAFLRVRTAAAAIALPGPDGLESVLAVTVEVGAGARFEYLPEPVVVSAGARHATIIRVTLAEGASLLLRDELLLGRHGEGGGTARTVLRVDYAGRALLRQSLEVSGADQASLGPAVLAGHRAVGTLLCVSPTLDPRPADCVVPPVTGASTGTTGQAGCAAVLQLAGPGVVVTALAHDAVTLRKRLTLPRSA